MSIALSITIHPSRCLRYAVRGLCSCIVVLSVAIFFGVIGHFSFAARFFILLSGVICTSFAIFQLHSQEKAFRLDISGIGNIRLMQYEDGQGSRMPLEPNSDKNGEIVRLMEGSTLWSGFMSLCLQSENGRVTVLRVLPDSVSEQEFRMLSVACRWVATRGNEPINLNHD